jgi:hypothetical protein
VASTPILYVIRIRGHLGATSLSAFPSLIPHAEGDDTVLTGLLQDRSALYATLAEVEALGLDLLELKNLTSGDLGNRRNHAMTAHQPGTDTPRPRRQEEAT